ncbi:hypothetical protein [Streptomyces melanogenes]|uniref:hypothetical protein n=1 Tax=Streptomyces melanogenes TaxID=67326 RepID=UPI00167C8BFC|nr:hypothetical protein [Streptomyces melanogenes]GGP61524.1 hypothetical protein GCM10010278_43430 [Streptomyces melanogenes]
MSVDVPEMVNEIAPYVTAAAVAYGAGVLDRTQDEAATAVVGLGRRLAQRVFGVRRTDEELPEALADVVEAPDDTDNQGALRKAVRKALLADGALADEVARMLAGAPREIRTGDGSPVITASVIGGDSIQIGSVGGNVRLTTAAH